MSPVATLPDGETLLPDAIVVVVGDGMGADVVSGAPGPVPDPFVNRVGGLAPLVDGPP